MTNDSPSRDRKNDETVVIVLRAGHMFHIDRYNHIQPCIAAAGFATISRPSAASRGLALPEAIAQRAIIAVPMSERPACAELNGHEVKE